MLVHKCLNGTVPSYLADVCIPIDTLRGCRQLRSAATGQLLVPRRSTNIGQRGFHCCGPATCNALPVSLCTDNRSSVAFGRALKRHLFIIWCRLPLFELHRLLLWRIVNALIIIIIIMIIKPTCGEGLIINHYSHTCEYNNITVTCNTATHADY